jgi:hypothetical protein
VRPGELFVQGVRTAVRKVDSRLSERFPQPIVENEQSECAGRPFRGRKNRGMVGCPQIATNSSSPPTTTQKARRQQRRALSLPDELAADQRFSIAMKSRSVGPV